MFSAFHNRLVVQATSNAHTKHSRISRRRSAWVRLSFESLETRDLLAGLTVTIDYTRDTNNFFDTQAKKDLLQLAADTIVSRFSDSLAAITPVGSNTWTPRFFDPPSGDYVTVASRNIAADEIVVYAGGRSMSGGTLGVGGPGGYSASGFTPWFNTLKARGQNGGLDSPATDFGNWGGSVAFASNATWHFGETTSGLSGKNDFFSVALHEMGHLLGFGTADSWDTYVSGGSFTGAKSVAEYDLGGNVPLASGNSHWANGTTDGGAEAAMDPSITTGTRKLMTKLDFAGLQDLGWTILTPDIRVLSATTTNDSTLSLTYEVTGSSAPEFSIGVYRSDDNGFDGGDTSLFTFTATSLYDRTMGAHTKTFSIGGGGGQIPLPGKGATETDNDYSLLVVADPSNAVVEDDVDPITEDNTARFSGVYAGSSGEVYVHGTTGYDSITASTGSVSINSVNFAFNSATTTSLRFRSGPSGDTVTGGSITNWMHGGDGVDLLIGGAAADTLFGDGDADTLEGRGGNDTLNGGLGDDTYRFDADSPLGSDALAETGSGGGTDTLNFSDTTGLGLTVKLGQATLQTVNANVSITLGSATTFESIVGGALNDALTGNSLANSIQAGDGNDTLAGLAGDDVLSGQAGNDTYTFDADTALGSDSLVDSSGIDTLNFSTTTTLGVNADLSTATSQSINSNLAISLGFSDRFEYLIGGAKNDTLSGNALINQLTGGAGDDVLIGRAGNDTYLFDTDVDLGSDTLDETGGGTDLLYFASTTTLGVTVNLANAAFQTINGNLDLTLGSASTFENVTGGSQSDTITGNTLANSLLGGAGGDAINAGDGNDTLTGGAGDDTLGGGDGNDTYLFDADSNLGKDTFNQFDARIDTLNFSATTTMGLNVDLSDGADQTVNSNLRLSSPLK